MLDAVQFEDRGLPAAAIITEPFKATCHAMAVLNGFDDYPLVTVPHPVTSLSLKQVHDLADSITDAVERLLIVGNVDEVATVPVATLATVVEELAIGLRSDGADLTVSKTDDHSVVFELHIPDQACADCIMPARVLLPIFTSRIHAALGDHLSVTLVDPRDDASHPLNTQRLNQSPEEA